MASFKCEFCSSLLSTKGSLSTHVHKFHRNRSKIKDEPKMVCGMCNSRFASNNEFENHLKLVHEVTVVHEKASFKTEDAFKAWLRGVENDHQVRFIVSRSDKTSTKSTIYYICNRSGQPRFRVEPNERKRKLKTQGSCKSNYHCTARVTAHISTEGTVDVNYCLTHSGHEIELKHLPIPAPKKRELASQIAAKVPLGEIFNSFQHSINDSKTLERSHLITMQDLRNIITQFSLDKEFHSDDSTSVQAWVEKERASEGESSVILYKPKGSNSNEHPGITHDDFLIAIMTKDQEEVLKKYGENGCICMDSTHGTKKYGYDLTTLMVLDEMQHGFPAAFFISNRHDRIGIEVFLKSVKEKTGVINAKTFISDMAETFNIAWSSVMADCNYRLYCTWHVIAAWRKKINTTIKCERKRKAAYDRVHTLLTETDEVAFSKIFPSVVTSLCEEDETKDFGRYFRDNYTTNCMQWAYCYRKHAGVYTDMHLERMHGALKHIYLKGKKVKRLGVTIHALTRLINRKVFDRLIVLEKGKLANKLRILRKRHVASLSMDTFVPSPVSPGSWTLFSSQSNESYTLNLVDSNCSCAISCRHCMACVHAYSCSCIDYCIKSNMCKHVHFLCQFLIKNYVNLHVVSPQILPGESDPTPMDFSDDSTDMRIDDEPDYSETIPPVDSLRPSGSGYSSHKKSQILRKEVEASISSIMRSIQTEEEMVAFKNIISSAIPVLKAIRNRQS